MPSPSSKNAPKLNEPIKFERGNTVLPISVGYGPVYRASYTTTRFDSVVEIDLTIEIIARWEEKSDGFHWMQLTVWVDNEPKPYFFSGEVKVNESGVTRISTGFKKVVAAGKQHVIVIQHDGDGSKALQMNIVGTIRKK